jgi:flagellar basal-body rod modification protein FlgD
MSSINTSQDLFASLGLSRAQQDIKGTNDASELGLDTFLKLMVTQLNNQDPMKPMENNTFLSQIAQFGSVTGLDKLNNQIQSLSTSLTSGQALQAGSLVGHQVLVPMDVGSLQSGQAIGGQVSIPESSSQVTVRIYDTNGQLVRELPMGAADSGELQFNWDGTNDQGQFMPSGKYQVEVSAQYGDQDVLLQPELFADVESVSLSANNGLTLNLAGLGPVAFNSVKQIY